MQYCHSPVVDLNPVHGSFSNIENVDQCRPDETRMGHDGDAILIEFLQNCPQFCLDLQTILLEGLAPRRGTPRVVVEP